MVTGKPLTIGGSRGRVEATGRGLMIIAREVAPPAGFELAGSRVAVQGFGNVGSVTAKMYAHAAGATIVAVSDIRGGIVNDAGLDVPAVLEYYGRKKSLEGFPGGEAITNEQLSSSTRATSWCRRPTRTSSAATTLRACGARIIVEGANGPTTQKADNIFRERGIIVVPDILANAGA